MRIDWGEVVVQEGGVITLPTDLLTDLGWQPGDDLTIEVIDKGFVIDRAKSGAA